MTAITPPLIMPNVKERSCQNCDHFQAARVTPDPDNLATAGECRAHPPGFCCDDITAHLWPRIVPRDENQDGNVSEFWCDEWKRRTYARHTVLNSKNPTLNPAAICCKSCDHFQPSIGDTIAGICCAHPPHACCVIPGEIPPLLYTQENAFPQIALNAEIPAWCDEWKRTTT